MKKELIEQIKQEILMEMAALNDRLAPLKYEYETLQTRLQHIQEIIKTFDTDEKKEFQAQSEIQEKSDLIVSPEKVKNLSAEFLEKKQQATKDELWDYALSKGYIVGGAIPKRNFAAHLSTDSRFYYNKRESKWELREKKLI